MTAAAVLALVVALNGAAGHMEQPVAVMPESDCLATQAALWAIPADQLADGPALDAACYPLDRLPACEMEDSDNCYWNAATRGNGRGRSFASVNGALYYLGETP
jgi:hypothetical protein